MSFVTLAILVALAGALFPEAKPDKVNPDGILKEIKNALGIILLIHRYSPIECTCNTKKYLSSYDQSRKQSDIQFGVLRIDGVFHGAYGCDSDWSITPPLVPACGGGRCYGNAADNKELANALDGFCKGQEKFAYKNYAELEEHFNSNMKQSVSKANKLTA